MGKGYSKAQAIFEACGKPRKCSKKKPQRTHDLTKRVITRNRDSISTVRGTLITNANSVDVGHTAPRLRPTHPRLDQEGHYTKAGVYVAVRAQHGRVDPGQVVVDAHVHFQPCVRIHTLHNLGTRVQVLHVRNAKAHTFSGNV